MERLSAAFSCRGPPRSAPDRGRQRFANSAGSRPDRTERRRASCGSSPGGFAWCNEERPISGWHWHEQPIERIEAIPRPAVGSGEGVWALPLGDNRLALFYNGATYFEEKPFLKLSQGSREEAA